MSRPRHFWSAWPEARQRHFFKLSLMGTVLVTLSLFIGLKLLTGVVDQDIVHAKTQYGRVLPLVQEVAALRAQKGNLAHLNEKEAAWIIIDDLGIEPKLTSLHSTILDDAPAVEVTINGLSLAKLADFLDNLRKRASLQTPEFSLTRNPDNPRLADLNMVLAR
ncbi:hypothetical protein [Pseudodesulfovibrio sp.]|uniref:hypothetical protein n=1 Tax=unclassified Pseudodesulfovibrio TaxID=2661612 RepID=UPI003AFFE961